MSAYVLILLVHSSWRWMVLALLCVVLARGTYASARACAWSALDERLHKALLGVFDLQLALGLLLYLWLSPFVRMFYMDVGRAMHDSQLRFFGIEHLFGMSLALLVLHGARWRSKRVPTGPARRRLACATTWIAALLIVATVPWPVLPYGRPLLRGAGLSPTSQRAEIP